MSKYVPPKLGDPIGIEVGSSKKGIPYNQPKTTWKPTQGILRQDLHCLYACEIHVATINM